MVDKRTPAQRAEMVAEGTWAAHRRFAGRYSGDTIEERSMAFYISGRLLGLALRFALKGDEAAKGDDG